MELAIINGTYRDTKSGNSGTPAQTNGATSPSSLSPLGGATTHPAALAAAAVASRKWACCA